MNKLNRLETWEPGCWCAAMIQLNEPHPRAEPDGGLSQRPPYWACFAWAPQVRPMFFTPPTSWATMPIHPDGVLAGKTGNEPVYLLAEHEVDWPSLLEILLTCDDIPAWLWQRVSHLQESKIRVRRANLLQLYGHDRTAFEAYMQRVLSLPDHKELSP